MSGSVGIEAVGKFIGGRSGAGCAGGACREERAEAELKESGLGTQHEETSKKRLESFEIRCSGLSRSKPAGKYRSRAKGYTSECITAADHRPAVRRDSLFTFPQTCERRLYMYRLIDSSYTLADIGRFTELSIRRGIPLASVVKTEPRDRRVVVGAALLFVPTVAFSEETLLQRFEGFCRVRAVGLRQNRRSFWRQLWRRGSSKRPKTLKTVLPPDGARVSSRSRALRRTVWPMSLRRRRRFSSFDARVCGRRFRLKTAK